MAGVFLELIFDAIECEKVGIDSRDEIEDDLEDRLKKSGLGVVSGGGAGFNEYNIDVDIFDEVNLEVSISVIRDFLISIHVPQNSKMIRYKPVRQEIPVYPA